MKTISGIAITASTCVHSMRFRPTLERSETTDAEAQMHRESARRQSWYPPYCSGLFPDVVSLLLPRAGLFPNRALNPRPECRKIESYFQGPKERHPVALNEIDFRSIALPSRLSEDECRQRRATVSKPSAGCGHYFLPAQRRAPKRLEERERRCSRANANRPCKPVKMPSGLPISAVSTGFEQPRSASA